ncbi:hypothetical protein OG205_01440 [Lentzea sp. NBC_00516]|nr:hypothetical protein [Lentzea sp. NBC_00516]WUD25689.1 hypothetical protein OG205_01440 [Lentzea sp. NBC_00516]
MVRAAPQRSVDIAAHLPAMGLLARTAVRLHPRPVAVAGGGTVAGLR